MAVEDFDYPEWLQRECPQVAEGDRAKRAPDPAAWPDPWHDRQAGRARRRQLAHRLFVALAALLAAAFVSGLWLWVEQFTDLPGAQAAVGGSAEETPVAP